MVNTGHPSRACKLCRARRIKCDETKPTCLKCAKAKRVCPGYRDTFEINLRDETQTTIRKAKTAALRKAVREGRSIDGADVAEAMLGSVDTTAIDWSLVDNTANTNSFFHSSSSDPAGSTKGRKRAVSDTTALYHGWSTTQEAQTSVPRSVTTPIEQQAQCYFLANYVLAPPLGVGRGIMTFFLPLIEEPEYKTSPMRPAFLAMSTAALAGRPNSRSLFSLAHMWYTRAISELKVAMSNPSRPNDNMITAASMLLGFYEGLTGGNDLNEVFTHLNGAIAMVKVGGAELLETPVGLGIFEFARMSAIRQYMFLTDGSPEEINWWVRQAVCDKFGHHAIVLQAQTALLRSQADALVKSPRTGQKVEKVLALLQKIKDLQSELERWFEETPQHWRRTTTGTAPPAPPTETGPVTSGASGSTSAPCSATSATAPSRPTWTSPLSARSASSFSSSSPPTSARFPTSPTDQDDDIATFSSLTAYPSLPIYSYPNVWAAGKYIHSHICQLILHQAACRCIAWLCAPSDHKQIKEYRDAFAQGREQVEAVISSTPYFFGWRGDAATTPHFPCGTPDAPKGLAFVCCLWPLHACGTSIFASRRQRAYIKGRLAAMWEIMGIGQADVFAKSIIVGPPGAY